MGTPHETEFVSVPVPLLKKLIRFTEVASEVMLAEYASQSTASSALVVAEDACRLVLDNGFRLDG